MTSLPPPTSAPYPVDVPPVEFLGQPTPPPMQPPVVSPPVDGPPPIGGDGAPEPLPEPKKRRSWRLTPRSLTSKLVAGVVALVFVIVCATGACTYFAMRSYLFNRLDQQLGSTVNSDPSTIARLFIPQGSASLGAGLKAPQTVSVVALQTNGAVLLEPSNPGVEPLELSSSERQMLAARSSSSPVTLTTSDGQSLRVAIRPLILTNRETGQQVNTVIVVGLSTADVNRTLRRIVTLELLIGLGALLVALFATTYGVNFSLRRLKRVTETAQEVAAELSPDGKGLERRVPVVEEGTEVGQLAESMNTLLAAVETQFAARVESEDRMRQFLADASHELRTPLTSIRGYAELARMQRAAGDAGEDNLDRIESEGTRMSRLVEDLLMLARGDQDAVPRVELVDVSELVDDAVSGARVANPQRRIDVAPVPSYHVVGDTDQLLRVIRNLITNAVVHTPEGSPIRVGAFVDGPGIAIQVVDGGPGLPPEEAAHVFERFWRADKARTRARGGTGLGLSIVASIVQAHGGATHFESTVQGGSTVTVWLPGVTA